MKPTFTLRSKTLGGNFTKKNMMDNFGCQGGNISIHLESGKKLENDA